MVGWPSSRKCHHRVPTHSSCKCQWRLHRQLNILSRSNNSLNLEAPARSPPHLDCNSEAFPKRHCKHTYQTVRSSKCHLTVDSSVPDCWSHRQIRYCCHLKPCWHRPQCHLSMPNSISIPLPKNSDSKAGIEKEMGVIPVLDGLYFTLRCPCTVTLADGTVNTSKLIVSSFFVFGSKMGLRRTQEVVTRLRSTNH